MHRLCLFALILMIAGLAPGCAIVGADKATQAPHGSKVAVVSLLGNQMSIQHLGTTAFNNKKWNIEVQSWAVDQYVEDQANLLVEAGNKFTPVKDKADGYRQKFGSLEQNFWTGNRKYQYQSEGVQALVAESGADLVLMISPAEYGDVFFGTNQLFSGYGIYQRSFLRDRNALSFLMMTVQLIDAKSGEEIASAQQYASSKRADRDWLEDDTPVLTPENEATTKQELLQLMQGLLKKGLADLKLTN
ncbi:MAG: hypothetical protein WC696_05855 [Candidatus Methylopumilus sp.]|jgi:hypothetical protein